MSSPAFIAALALLAALPALAEEARAEEPHEGSAADAPALRVPDSAALRPLDAPPAAPAPQVEELAAPPAEEPAARARRKDETPTFGLSIVARRKSDARIVGSAHTITDEQLQKHEHDDIQRIVKDVPGVYVREEDGFGLRPNIGLRGASSDRSSKVTLMEDGVLFGPAPYAAPAAYFFPLATRLTGLEVFKGPASVRSGPQTVGGALNLLTRPIPATPSGGVDLAGGLYNTGKLHAFWGTSSDRAGFLVEGVRLQSDGFKQLDGGGDTGFDKNEVMLKGHLTTLPGAERAHKLELKLGYSDESSRETYLGLSEADFQANPWRRYAASRLDLMEFWRTQAELAHSFSIGKTLELRTVAYRHDFSRAWRKLNRIRGAPDLATILKSPASGRMGIYQAILAGREDSREEVLGIGTNDRTFVAQGIQTTGKYETTALGFGHQLQFGLRLHEDSIRRVHTEDGYDMTGGVPVLRGEPTQTTTKNTGSARALAVHLLDEMDFGAFLVSPGARVEVIQMRLVDELANTSADRLDVVLLPGLGAAWQLSRSFSLLAGVHEGFSPVAPGQPSEVKPESSINVELGGRFASRRARAELIGFYNRYSNLTGECTNSSGCTDEQLNRQFNGGAVDVGGVEASASAEKKLTDAIELRGRASYTLTLSRFRTSFESEFPQFGKVFEGDELPYVPTHQASASVGVGSEQWELAAAATFVGAMRDRAGQGEMKPADWTQPQVVVDLIGNYSLNKANTLYLKADNLLDSAFVASRRPFGIRPAQPLMVMVGYKHAFGAVEEPAAAKP